MTSIALEAHNRKIIIGIDTHKYVHVAVAIDNLGTRLGDKHVSANREGYARLEAWATSFGRIAAFGIEGTGSYGVGLASFLRRSGHRIVEVNRGDRRSRRGNGKTDTLDAEAAARAVLSGEAVAVPKPADGTVEMIRQLKIARDTARKARTSAIVTLKALLVTCPAELREHFDDLTDKILIDRCAGLRPGAVSSPTASAKHSLRALAKRYITLSDEIAAHDAILDELTAKLAPTLRDGFGIGVDTASEVLIVFGDNPDRVHSEAAFAKLCGVCPIPASSGMTSRHRLSRRSPRSQRSHLPGRHRPHAVPRTDDRLRRSTNRRRAVQEGHHPLPQAVRRTRDLPARHGRLPRSTATPGATSGPLLTYRGVNALAESFNGLYKWELIHRQGPWNGLEDVEFATMTYVEWFNNRRLHERITQGPGYTTPAAHEAAYYRQSNPAPEPITQ